MPRVNMSDPLPPRPPQPSEPTKYISIGDMDKRNFPDRELLLTTSQRMLVVYEILVATLERFTDIDVGDYPAYDEVEEIAQIRDMKSDAYGLYNMLYEWSQW